MHYQPSDTIVALSTAPGRAAIAIVRLSGPDAIRIAGQFFYNRSLLKKNIDQLQSHTSVFGVIMHDTQVVDEVLLTVFRDPRAFTGEDTIEVSCHGSLYIQQKILQLFLSQGARVAEPGEFTLRAFLNGKLDLTQAEAVADLIAGSSATAHEVAMKQMRGGFSAKITVLREKLIEFASLIELELDFGEEDVEFADRTQLKNLLFEILTVVNGMVRSFELGNVIKNGVPVAIAGRPNAGKSTLLNTLLEDERAIVSEIPGTTRDVIEDQLVIEGVLFRVIDTAGLRETEDAIEKIGVEKAYSAMMSSAIVIYLFDAGLMNAAELAKDLGALPASVKPENLMIVANKADLKSMEHLLTEFSGFPDMLFISARQKQNIEAINEALLDRFHASAAQAGDTIVTNARHARALQNAAEALEKVRNGISQMVPGDLLALDLRYALNELGGITGQVTSEDLLGSIFSRFCIGK